MTLIVIIIVRGWLSTALPPSTLVQQSQRSHNAHSEDEGRQGVHDFEKGAVDRPNLPGPYRERRYRYVTFRYMDARIDIQEEIPRVIYFNRVSLWAYLLIRRLSDRDMMVLLSLVGSNSRSSAI